MDNKVYLPFYMTYPVAYPYRQDNRTARDIEYLREMYPEEAKKLLSRIAEVLDKLDYEESMIYDEYPDRWQLYRLAENITKIIEQEAQEQGETYSPEKEQWLGDMVQILLFDEIFNRRHGNKQRQKNHVFIDKESWKASYGDTGNL